MGTLIAMAYPTKLFANAADHTYVKCGTGKRAWGCWGGKTGGKELRRGTGSTKRANAIAERNERAGITCYLINGVCHQAANRILLPARITVNTARGYRISEALFGTYGRVGIWPCKATFKKHSGVTGDLPACVSASARASSARLTADDKLDRHYLERVLSVYEGARSSLSARTFRPADAHRLGLTLFMVMAEFHLGPTLAKGMAKKLRQVRAKTEATRIKCETSFRADDMSAKEFVQEFDRQTVHFQNEMASALRAEEYRSLFDLEPGETVTLADPAIVKKEFKTR
jgi:hypothetical protein